LGGALVWYEVWVSLSILHTRWTLGLRDEWGGKEELETHLVVLPRPAARITNHTSNPYATFRTGELVSEEFEEGRGETGESVGEGGCEEVALSKQEKGQRGVYKRHAKGLEGRRGERRICAVERGGTAKWRGGRKGRKQPKNQEIELRRTSVKSLPSAKLLKSSSTSSRNSWLLNHASLPCTKVANSFGSSEPKGEKPARAWGL
jgi:hypothetical protein